MPNAQGLGFCGAGYEGHLLLLKISNSTLNIADKYLVDSCLESISLTSDQGDDPFKALVQTDDKDEILTYDTIEGESIKTHKIYTQEDHFVIK